MKQAYDILGQLNFDYNREGIEIFRKMDVDGDMKVSRAEFVEACVKDDELCSLLEGSLGQKMFD